MKCMKCNQEMYTSQIGYICSWCKPLCTSSYWSRSYGEMPKRRGEFYRKVLGRGPKGDSSLKAMTRTLECGHIVLHSETISYNPETGKVTWDRYVWCRECEKKAEG